MLEKIKSILIVSIIFFIFVMLFPGCEESQKSPSGSGKIKSDNPAVKIILDAIRDPDPRIRAKAVEVIASAEQYALMAEAEKLLRDDFVPVRFLAAIAVGDLKYIPAQADIKKLLNETDQNVKIAAAYAAEKIGILDNSFDIIAESARSKNQTLRSNAAMLLGKRGNKDALKLLHWIKNDKNSDDKSRFQATEALARLGDKTIYQKIWTMLLSPYNDVRIMGTEAMGALGTIEAQNALITMLDDNIIEVRLSAAQQLGSLGNPIGEPEIADIFEKGLLFTLEPSEQLRVKSRTAMAIGYICSDDLKKYLPKLLKDKSKLVKIAAAKADLLCDKGNTDY